MTTFPLSHCVASEIMTCIMKDKIFYTNLFRILESFGECSGLKVNDEKTETVPLGNKTLKSIKKSINVWKWRGLSLLERIQIVKTFAIPKLMFRASVIPTSKELIKEANSIFYNFIWNGKDKVKRRTQNVRHSIYD